MTGHTHAVCGTAALLVLTASHPMGMDLAGYTISPAIGIATVVFGSLLPDIDLQQSSMGHRHKFISSLFTHRGMTHTLVFPGILVLFMMFLLGLGIPTLPSLVFGLLYGWLAHIEADLFNGKGVPLLWPIYRKRIHIDNVLTTSSRNNKKVPIYRKEGVFLFVWVGVCIAWSLITFK